MSRSNPSHLPARAGSVLPIADPIRELPSNFGGDGGIPPELGTDWRRIRSALWRFKWLVLTLPMLAAVGGYGASRLVKPVYVAHATVWINKQAEATNTQLQPGAQFGTDAWIDLFRSYTVIDRAVSERHLSLSVQPFDSALAASFAGFDERFTPGSFTITVDSTGKSYRLTAASGVVVERGPVGGPVGVTLGYRWKPPAASLPAGKSISFSVLSPRQAALALLDRLRVTIDATGTFLHVDLSGGNPTLTAETLNSIVQNFVRVAASFKSAGLADRTSILDRQMKSAQADLTAAESALEQFRVQSITRSNLRSVAQRPSPGDQATDPAATAYYSMQAAMDSAVRDSRTIRRALAQAGDSGLVIGELEHVPSVVASSELSGALKDLTTKRADLRGLQLKFTDSHPLVVKARAELSTLERVEIPTLANRVLLTLSTREAELSTSVTSTARDLHDTPALASTEARLQRSVTLAEGLYSQLQPRFAEAQLAEGSAVPDVKALDPAEPPQFGDKAVVTTRLILAAFLAGIGLAVAAALQLDKIDPKFRYPDQVTRELGLSILGAVPHVTSKGKSGERVEESAAFQEALRDIRMNVAYAYGTASPLILTVSSSGPADGKSFISANVARSFAESGHRTLLIDADLRRGELHRRFGVSRRPGLTDCLRGDVDVERIIQQTKFAKLDLITSGTRKHDAPELLGSPATAVLFGEFRSRYDVIICDSPPLSAGVDPFLLSALSGNLLLVVRTGVSVREVIESKLEVLGRMPVRILGAVLNDVPRSAVYGYYSSYVPGYDTSDETGSALRRIIS